MQDSLVTVERSLITITIGHQSVMTYGLDQLFSKAIEIKYFRRKHFSYSNIF